MLQIQRTFKCHPPSILILRHFWLYDGKYPGDIESQEYISVLPLTGIQSSEMMGDQKSQ